jgi:hypothetical protein
LSFVASFEFHRSQFWHFLPTEQQALAAAAAAAALRCPLVLLCLRVASL